MTKLKTARLMREMSQTELAEKAGINHATISAIERGTRYATIYSAVRICKALGCTLDDLFWPDELEEINEG